MSARARIVGWMVLLVGLALAVSVVLSWRVLLARVDERVNAEIAHEADKLRTFASSATDPGGRPYSEVDALLGRYLRETLPEAEDEAFFSIVAGRPTYRSPGSAPARLDTDPAFVARVASAAEPAYGWADSPVGAVRYAVLPVRAAGDPRQGALVVLEFRDLQRREVIDAVRVLTLVGFGALGVAGLVSWLLAGRVLAPIRLVRQTAERIGESDLTRRITVGGDDDVAQLARTFNNMLDRLEAAFAAQRRFLDDAGHELRTPITVIRGHLDLMGDDPADRRDTTALVTDELDRMSRIVDDLIVLAKAEQHDFLTLAPVDVADLTVEVAAKARALGPRQWTVAEVAETTILADGQRLTQALLQLATNAFGSWWPAEYHIGQADMATAILEPRAGGRWYEQGVDGSECDWGQVLAWEPPHRLVVTWQINGQWQYDPDPEHASEIEVRFSAEGPDQTTVELEHRLLDRLVDGQALRDGITGGGGWPSLLELFAKAATNHA